MSKFTLQQSFVCWLVNWFRGECCSVTMLLSMPLLIYLFITLLVRFSIAGGIHCGFYNEPYASNCKELCESKEDCVYNSVSHCYKCVSKLDVIITAVIITVSVIGGILIIVFIIWGGWCCYRHYYPSPEVIHTPQPVYMQTVPMGYATPQQPVYYSAPQPVMVEY